MSSPPPRTRCGLLLLLMLAPLREVAAIDAVTLDIGHGLEDTRLLRLNVSHGEGRPLFASARWRWSYYWEGNLSYWYLYKQKEGEKRLLEVGLTPNLRLEPRRAWRWGRPFVEAGIGVRLLSKVHIGARDLSSAFQFGSHAGFGLRFGEREAWEAAWRIEHLSNAGLRQPNPGINFTMVRLGYHW